MRSVDVEEAEIIRDLGVRIFTMKDLDEMGAANCYRRALRIASPKGEPIHLSFDVDGVDESMFQVLVLQFLEAQQFVKLTYYLR